jgi:hypothetical protein
VCSELGEGLDGFIKLIEFSFISSLLSVFTLKKYLLSTYFVPDTVLSSGDTMNEIERM